MKMHGILVRIHCMTIDASTSFYYPNFQMLPSVVGRWQEYVDLDGGGWVHDSGCDHTKNHWSILLAPMEFCEEALSDFPDRCVEIVLSEVLEAAIALPWSLSRELDFQEIGLIKREPACTCIDVNLPHSSDCPWKQWRDIHDLNV